MNQMFGVSSLLKRFRQILIVLVAVFFCLGCKNLSSAPLSYNPWQVVPLPTKANLLDISFSTPTHGWVVGSNATLFETTDGGKTWQQRVFELDEPHYRFTSVSFSGQEGWIVGQPVILLHTTDEGRSWTQTSISSNLPGSPYNVVALGDKTAEIATDVGAIYKTEDGGQSWKALLEEAFGVVRNIARSPDGQYIAVSAKGNFYSTWAPGQTTWEGHNRNSSRRLENMGFGQDGRLWMLARGGLVQFADPSNQEQWGDPLSPEKRDSWGLLDLAYRTPQELWVSGGSGNLLQSLDGGQTWQKDLTVENVPANLNRIIFFNPDQGFILGQRGTLLRYDSTMKAT